MPSQHPQNEGKWTITWSSWWTTALTLLLLGLMWSYLLMNHAGAGDQWVFPVVFIPHVVVAVGVFGKSDWARQSVRLLSWIGAIAGGYLTLIYLPELVSAELSHAIMTVFPLAITTAVSLRNLFWLDDLTVPRQCRLKLLIGMAAVFTIAGLAFGYFDTCLILFQLAVVILLIRSVIAFRNPDSIRTRWQAMYHATMIAVSAVFPITTLCGLTIGLPFLGLGWGRIEWQAAAKVAPTVLAVWTVVSGGLIWLVPILIGIVSGHLWWKRRQRGLENRIVG